MSAIRHAFPQRNKALDSSSAKSVQFYLQLPLCLVLQPFLLIWLLSWVPLLNLLTPFAWFAFAAWVMALQYADYPMGNHQIRFPRQRRILRRCPTASLGFGASTALVTMIPLLNFVVIPAAVAGATVLWYEQLEKIADKTP